MARRSIGVPVTVGIVLIVLVLALAVGWQVLVWTDLGPDTTSLPMLDWLLLVLGTVFFAVVAIGLVWLSSWLVAEVRLNQRQRAFLDAVTHEMKTPLASVRLGLETLGRHQLDDARRRDFMRSMGEDLDRLDETIALVLAAARAEEGGRNEWRRKPAVDLAEVIGDSVRELAERHDLPETAVTVDPIPPTRVLADRSELALIFRNLLENAFKYSRGQPAIHVSVEQPSDGRVSVAIGDEGIGIPRRDLRKVFHRFYRAGRDVQRQAPGLGLGLFVVRAMVRKQGGRVVAESEGAGKGSRFVVTLRTEGRSELGARPVWSHADAG
jgi:signal transduction histidine kinase